MTAADQATRLDAALYRPAEPAATPPPCVVWVYGGPHAQYVKNAWEMTVSPLRQYLAQCGVAVLVVDNRGSNFRGLAFEAPLAGHLGGVEIADQCAAVEQLAAAGEIDGARVAITGGSYGGFMTLMSVIRRPDVFRCGVAIAPVTDQPATTPPTSSATSAAPATSRRPTPAHRSCPTPKASMAPCSSFTARSTRTCTCATRSGSRRPSRPRAATSTWSCCPTIGTGCDRRPACSPGTAAPCGTCSQGLGVQLPAEFGTASGEAV